MSKLVTTTVLSAAVGVVGFAPPAAADPSFPPPPADVACTLGNQGEIYYDIESAEVQPALTQFMSINITPGTTGERTETLTVIKTVTTMLGASTESSFEWSPVFGKISAKVGFEVQRTTSSTSNETTTMRWTFSQPGYYGLYKGTRAVDGTVQKWTCDRLYIPIKKIYKAYWVYLGGKSYTTFANMEAGTIGCGDDVPDGSLRLKARMQLGC